MLDAVNDKKNAERQGEPFVQTNSCNFRERNHHIGDKDKDIYRKILPHGRTTTYALLIKTTSATMSATGTKIHRLRLASLA